MADTDRQDDGGEARTFSAAERLDLSRNQKREIEAQSRPNAALIHETIRAEGESELTRSWTALLLSGFAAGLSMGLSLMVQGLLHSHLEAGPSRELIGHFGYTVGFLVVVLGRQQLFTENTLTPVLPLLYNRDAKTLGRVIRLWIYVLAANIAGAWLFAAVVAHSSIFDAQAKQAFSEIAAHTLASPFTTTFLRAVTAGWLIALMVWLLPAAEGSRPLIIIVITYVVSLASLSHIIAGAVDCLYLVETGQASLRDFALVFFLPTLLGNTLGGVALVAVLNYGQVASEIEE
jgi:formate/nitrite transporter FocA (FNT family)